MLSAKELVCNELSMPAPFSEGFGSLAQMINATLMNLGYSLPLAQAHEAFLTACSFSEQPIQSFSGDWFGRLMRHSHGPIDATWATFVRLEPKHGVLVISIRPTSTTKLKLCVASVSTEQCDGELSEVCSAIQEAITGIHKWDDNANPNERFSEMSKEFSPPNYSDTQFEIARSLKQDKSLCQFLHTIKATGGGMLRRDINKKTDGSPDPDELLSRLANLGLVKSEFVVICRRTSEQINRVPQRQAILDAAGLGLRCSCGRLISEERIEEILAVTDEAVSMLDGSHWMTVTLVDSLVHCGVPIADIRVNVTDGPEEVDAFVTIGNSLILFELKDSQFSMGHAYAFGGRVGLYKPVQGIIWASLGVAPEVKEHFKRAKPGADVCYIESTTALDAELYAVLSTVSTKVIEKVLQPLDVMGTVTIDLPGALLRELKHQEELLNLTRLQVAPTLEHKAPSS